MEAPGHVLRLPESYSWREPFREGGERAEAFADAAKFEPETGTWKLLDGPAVQHTVEPTRRAILDYLTEHSDSAPKQIHEGTGLAYATVKQTVRRMLEDGQLVSDMTGHYRIPGTVTAVTAVTAVSAPAHSPNDGDSDGDTGVTAVTAPTETTAKDPR